MHTNLPFTISGKVIAGSRQATGLGYPTANLDAVQSGSLSHGVYIGAATCESFFTDAPCVIFYGIPYSLDSNGTPRFEIHVLDASLPDMYDNQAAATLLAFIRRNEKFADSNLLRDAIANDIDKTRAYFHSMK